MVQTNIYSLLFLVIVGYCCTYSWLLLVMVVHVAWSRETQLQDFQSLRSPSPDFQATLGHLLAVSLRSPAPRALRFALGVSIGTADRLPLRRCSAGLRGAEGAAAVHGRRDEATLHWRLDTKIPREEV